MLHFNGNEYIISDLHLTHKNIIKYCKRPYEMTSEGVGLMMEDIFKLFDALPENCIVWNLGDLLDTSVAHSIDEVRAIVDRMKGPKGLRKLYLILGNHDNCKLNKSRITFYYEAGFNKVYDTPIIVSDKFILSHEPVYLDKSSIFTNLYGHTHDKAIESNYFCYDWEKVFIAAREARAQGLEEPEPKIAFPEKEIDTNKYLNVCYDYNHRFLDLSKILKRFK